MFWKNTSSERQTEKKHIQMNVKKKFKKNHLVASGKQVLEFLTFTCMT